MDWKKVSIMTTEEGLEFLCYKLDEIGITQFEMVEDAASTQKILDETAQYWDYVDAESVLAARQPCVRVYLSDNDVGAEQMKKLTAMVDELRSIKDGLDLGSLEIVSENVRDEDWANNWKQFYKPMAVGKRLMVTPSWENPPEGTGRITLKMDPGMVFGTGAHETTQLCLAQLDEYVKPGMKVIDLGCGSGILFIGGMLLGAKEAYAVDIEENATRIAKENAAENHLNPENYTISCGNIITDTALRESIGSGYDVITANIVADVIKGMAPLFPSFLKDNGILILSGIITERADEVLDTVTAYDFAVLERREASGWCAVKLQKLAGAGTCCDTLRK